MSTSNRPVGPRQLARSYTSDVLTELRLEIELVEIGEYLSSISACRQIVIHDTHTDLTDSFVASAQKVVEP